MTRIIDDLHIPLYSYSTTGERTFADSLLPGESTPVTTAVHPDIHGVRWLDTGGVRLAFLAWDAETRVDQIIRAVEGQGTYLGFLRDDVVHCYDWADETHRHHVLGCADDLAAASEMLLRERHLTDHR